MFRTYHLSAWWCVHMQCTYPQWHSQQPCIACEQGNCLPQINITVIYLKDSGLSYRLHSQPTLTTFPTAFPWWFTLHRALLACPNPLHTLASFFNQPFIYMSFSVSHFLIYFLFCPSPEDLCLTNYLLYAVFWRFLLLSWQFFLYSPFFFLFSLLPSPSCLLHPPVYASSYCLKIISGPSAPEAGKKYSLQVNLPF